MPCDMPPARLSHCLAGLLPADSAASPVAATKKVGLHLLWQPVECYQVRVSQLWKPTHYFFRSFYVSESLDHGLLTYSISFISLFVL